MSKKRPRNLRRSLAHGTKLEANYWRHRLFRNSYTYKGKTCEVNHWSVKIQHLGKRKTFALQAPQRNLAAAEACQIYRKMLVNGSSNSVMGEECAGVKSDGILAKMSNADPWRPAYWAERLIDRAYTAILSSRLRPELSVRIMHRGRSRYFPLGTDVRAQAAKRALRIYQVILGQGWELAQAHFRYELNVAFRWSDSPLAWTYTTIHTRTNPPPSRSRAAVGLNPERLTVALIESDAGVRQALTYWINRMEDFTCVACFACAADALREVASCKPQLVLLNHNLADKTGPACLGELRGKAPGIAGLLYSVHEDSEELFRSTPGGAGFYNLVRTTPTQFLAPIAELVRKKSFSTERMAPEAWQYFKNTLAALPIGEGPPETRHLTPREHEVLALLSHGYADKVIADRLHISIYTVHVHVRNIFEKLGVHNRTGAVMKYFQK